MTSPNSRRETPEEPVRDGDLLPVTGEHQDLAGDPHAAYHQAPVEEAPAEPPVDGSSVESAEGGTGQDDAEQEEPRGVPVGGVLAGGGAVTAIAGEAMWQAFGALGLAASAIVAAGGAVLYRAHRTRRGNPFTQTGRSRRSGGRLVTGGRSGKLGGGRGAKLGGGRGGPKLGKGRGAGLGGRPGKLGGRGARLGGGRSGWLGGGRDSRLGGSRSGLGKGRGGGSSRLGMPGGGKGRGVLGRGGRAGLGLGRRGGGRLGGVFGRWGKSTGAGAGILGSKLGRRARTTARNTARRAGQAALATKAGRRAQAAAGAAKVAAATSGNGRWGRWSAARKAARSTFGTPKHRYSAWSASTGAGFIALMALLHQAWKARQAKKQAAANGATTTTTTTTTTTSAAGTTTTTTTTTTATTRGAIPYVDASRRALGPGAVTRNTYTRRNTMGFPLASAAADVNTAAAGYAPPDMWTVATDMKQLPDVFANVALALRVYVQRLQGSYPIAPPVVDAMAQLYSGLTQLAQHAQEVEPLFRAAHAEDLKRGEQPRPGEAAWNV